MPIKGLKLLSTKTCSAGKGKLFSANAFIVMPCLASQKHLVTTYGQKWVVFTVLVQIPGAKRPWALPIELDLYWTKKYCECHEIAY